MSARWIILGLLLGPFVIVLAIFLGDELLDQWLVVVDRGPVGGKIRRAALVDGAKSIDIAALTAFDWTKFNVYGSYQLRTTICAENRLSWLDCRKVPSMIEEGEFLLFFRTTRGSVYMERHDRYEGDFTDSGAPTPVLPARAIFEVALEVQDRGSPPWVLLRWRP